MFISPHWLWVKVLMGTLVGYFVFSSPASACCNFGLLSASLSSLLCKQVWNVWLILALNQNQQRKTVQNSNEWLIPDKINHRAPHLFLFLLHSGSSFFLTHLQSLNLLFPLQVGPSPKVTLQTLSPRYSMSEDSDPRQRRKKDKTQASQT